MGLMDWLKSVAGPEGTFRTLMVTYQSFAQKGYPKQECLFKMFSTRPGWNTLPEAFLWELAERLAKEEYVAVFVALAEQYEILSQNIQTIARDGMAPRVLATTLTGLGNHLAGEKNYQLAATTFNIALSLDPEWFPAMGSLGLIEYMKGEHAQAADWFKKYFSASEAFKARATTTPPQAATQGAHEVEVMYRGLYQECLRILGRDPSSA